MMRNRIKNLNKTRRSLFVVLFMVIGLNAYSLTVDHSAPQNYQGINFAIPNDAGSVTLKAVEIFKRLLKERTDRDFFKPAKKSLTIKLLVDNKSLSAESFRIENQKNNNITIIGGDEAGILFGLGRLLHTSQSLPSGFSPSSWQGVSKPDGNFRSIYFATHFYNFYQSAPIEKVTNYVEELSMWGYNGIHVWFDMHHYEGINNPEAQKMLDRLAVILRAGQSVGMKSGIVMLANEGYKNSPKQLRADPKTSSGYHYHVEICPSIPEGADLIVRQVDEELNEFIKRKVHLDRITVWPYDQGGCACKLCSPWGANGYLKITKRLSGLFKAKIPQAELIMSTWLFDFEEKDLGEWSGLAKAFKQEKPWVDYIMADSHTTYPSYLLNNPVPGNLPLLNFPEISMWGNWPWGGYGANPFPERIQQLWTSVADKLSGGYPYSEGIFEDLNKILYAQFYWNKDKTAKESLNEYVSFEYSPKYAAEIIEAIGILEKNYGMSTEKWAKTPGAKNVVEMNPDDFGAKKAYDILLSVDKKLPQSIRKSWRWRILLLRSQLDYELRLSKGSVNDSIDRVFKELITIQHLENADPCVQPPVVSARPYTRK